MDVLYFFFNLWPFFSSNIMLYIFNRALFRIRSHTSQDRPLATCQEGCLSLVTTHGDTNFFFSFDFRHKLQEHGVGREQNRDGKTRTVYLETLLDVHSKQTRQGLGRLEPFFFVCVY